MQANFVLPLFTGESNTLPAGFKQALVTERNSKSVEREGKWTKRRLYKKEGMLYKYMGKYVNKRK